MEKQIGELYEQLGDLKGRLSELLEENHRLAVENHNLRNHLDHQKEESKQIHQILVIKQVQNFQKKISQENSIKIFP